MTARFTFELPSDVTRRALRFPAVRLAAFRLRIPAGELATSAAVQEQHRAAVDEAAHEGERQPCLHCQLEGHDVRWRGYPVLDPGPCPPGDVIQDVVEGCHCCFWGVPGRRALSLYDRLTREAHQGRDVPVEHLDRRGRWSKFQTRFEVA
ncbi:hypothetical protein [Amycolatopsis vancoresmycina]|uniref:hypothetical protein n=1 Tax=Amycolatopsis vancoresmycina TaxID=208444 RepID=UPI000525BC4B|nr:hypothetical protein [Amycolatopsis vancoresmycina]